MLRVNRWVGLSVVPRTVAYSLVGAAVLALANTNRPSQVVFLATVYFLLVPWAMHGWTRRRASHRFGAQLVESGLTGFATGLVAAPWLTCVGVVACLVMANAALGGRGLFWRALAPLAAGLAMGFAISGAHGFETSSWICDGLSGLLIVWFGAVVGFRGFDQATRIATAKDALMRKSQELEALSARLATYLPSQLSAVGSASIETRHGRTERKWLTVLFVDIAGFTRLTEQLAPGELAALLNDYLRTMTAVAHEHGGTVDKFIGDAVMVFFGDPQSHGHERDAVACTRMALAMRERFAALCERWVVRCPAARLNVRIGMDSGFCLVGDFGSGERFDYTAVGRTVNLASRLEQAAGSQQILMSRGTWELVKDQLACEFSGHLRVKGIAESIETFECRGLRAQQAV